MVYFKQLIKRMFRPNRSMVAHDPAFNPSNDIRSLMASRVSIKGHHISVAEGVYICDNSIIGSYNQIGFNTLISKSEIGRYNSIASNVNIGHGEHPIDSVTTNMLFIDDAYNVLTAKNCIVENDVWIGVNATIRRGVTIGTGAVIGANSFVNKDVPPYAVVGGVSAKIIKYRFEQREIDQLLASQWWTKDFEEAKKIIDELKKGNAKFI